tara:strand:- start:515 stop:1189 length:675 start_codon:yes stop_codon:yes gene_type:complete
MKVVCMIPARAGSKRIKNKNLRDLGGIPMMAHVIRAAKQADCFDEIYVNSECDQIGQCAQDEGVRFYKRPEELASDEATNDQFMEDFMKSVDCDYVVQLLPTSPFITPKEIQEFTKLVARGDKDTVVSVKDVQIECVYDGKPINFDQRKPTPPSQDLKPIQAYACSLMGWRKDNFLQNMIDLGCAYHGGEGNILFVPIKGFSEIDIDNEEDFELAESVWRHINE